MKASLAALGFFAILFQAAPALADKLDDIISSGVVRCGVVLDFPPMGLRDSAGRAVGFDVDYCDDLAAALGVKAEVVEVTFPERIPALMANRIDVTFASDTLERAKTVGFSSPYYAYEIVATAAPGIEMLSWEEMKGKTVGATAGNYEGIWLEDTVKEWGVGTYRPFPTQADVFLALGQGQIDAAVSTAEVANANVASGNYGEIKVIGKTSAITDFVALTTVREEYGFINFLDLFVNQQTRTGRYAELYKKWMGEGVPAELSVPGVYR